MISRSSFVLALALMGAILAGGAGFALVRPGLFGLQLPMPGEAYALVSIALIFQAFLLILAPLAILKGPRPGRRFHLGRALLVLGLVGFAFIDLSLAVYSLIALPEVNFWHLGLGGLGLLLFAVNSGVTRGPWRRMSEAAPAASGGDASWAQWLGGYGALFLRLSLYLSAATAIAILGAWLTISMSLALIRNQFATVAWHGERLATILAHGDFAQLLLAGPGLAAAATLGAMIFELVSRSGQARRGAHEPLSPAHQAFAGSAGMALEDRAGALRGTFAAWMALIAVMAVFATSVSLSLLQAPLERRFVLSAIDARLAAEVKPILVTHEIGWSALLLVLFLIALGWLGAIALSYLIPRLAIYSEATLLQPMSGFDSVERALRGGRVDPDAAFDADRFLLNQFRARRIGVMIMAGLMLGAFSMVYRLDRADYNVFTETYIETGQYWTMQRVRWPYSAAEAGLECRMNFGRPQPQIHVLLPDGTQTGLLQYPLVRVIAVDRKLREAQAAHRYLVADGLSFLSRVDFGEPCLAQLRARVRPEFQPTLFALLRVPEWYKQKWQERIKPPQKQAAGP